MSKRGLSARLYAPNQTLIMVNARLPQGNLAAANAAGRPRPTVGRNRASRSPNQNAHLLSQMGDWSPSGWWGHDACGRAFRIEGLALRLTVGRRGRTRAVLRHELVELFLVLGVTQPVEEILEFGLLLFEAL
jgi:hypothetical protein